MPIQSLRYVEPLSITNQHPPIDLCVCLLIIKKKRKEENFLLLCVKYKESPSPCQRQLIVFGTVGVKEEEEGNQGHQQRNNQLLLHP